MVANLRDYVPVYYIFPHTHPPSPFCHRFRVCQLVGKLMNYAADAQTSIGPNRLDKVEEVMMQRLYDKVGLLSVDVF